MIESLHIEDLGVIEEADLPLSRGLTALTGETGAGKTMVLTSLGLLLGQRAETTIVRTGAERSLVEGAFLVDPDSRAASRAVEAGADLDDDLLLASRTVPSTGRSRAYLGGRSVPASVLSEVGGRLVSVHGQADQLRLRSAAAQRAALDSLGGPDHAALCRRYSQAYQARRQAAQELQEWQASAQARSVEVAQLRTWLEALEEVDPRSGEDRDLTAEAERLDHAEDLRSAATGARTALSGEESATGQAPDVVSLIAYAHRSLSTESERDPALAELATRTQTSPPSWAGTCPPSAPIRPVSPRSRTGAESSLVPAGRSAAPRSGSMTSTPSWPGASVPPRAWPSSTAPRTPPPSWPSAWPPPMRSWRMSVTS